MQLGIRYSSSLHVKMHTQSECCQCNYTRQCYNVCQIAYASNTDILFTLRMHLSIVHACNGICSAHADQHIIGNQITHNFDFSLHGTHQSWTHWYLHHTIQHVSAKQQTLQYMCWSLHAFSHKIKCHVSSKKWFLNSSGESNINYFWVIDQQNWHEWLEICVYHLAVNALKE